jgi:hypothetical protein
MSFQERFSIIGSRYANSYACHFFVSIKVEAELFTESGREIHSPYGYM